jgi:hypothetical protein
MENKEGVLKLGVFMKFDSQKMTDEQALDKMEEVVLDLQDRFGAEVSIDVEKRGIRNLKP